MIGADGIMFVYDVTSRSSLAVVEAWLAEVKKSAPDSAVKFLIGNKADLYAQREVTYEEGLKLAKELGMEFMATSAKNGIYAPECLRRLAEIIYSRMVKTEAQKVAATKGSA